MGKKLSTLSICLLLFPAWAQGASWGQLVKKVTKIINDSPVHEATETVAKTLPPLSPTESRLLQEMLGNPHKLVEKPHFQNPTLLKAFSAKLESQPELLEPFVKFWYRRLEKDHREIRRLELETAGMVSATSTTQVKNQIAFMLQSGVKVESIASAMLTLAFNRQTNYNNLFLGHLQDVFSDLGGIKKLFDGRFLVDQTNGNPILKSHQDNLIDFLDQFVFFDPRKLNITPWDALNRMIPQADREKLDDLLLKVWRELGSDHPRLKEVLTKKLEQVISSVRNSSDVESALSDHLNFRIIARASDQDESFGQFVGSVLDAIHP